MSARAGRTIDLADQLDGPVRTCVGCRDRALTSALLRVVAINGVLTPDPRHRLPGRGAWLHPRVGCLDVAERRRVFGRALRLQSETLESTEVRVYIEPEHFGSQVVDVPDRGRILRPRPSTPKAGRPVVSTP